MGRRRIVIVEDEPGLVELYARMLRGAGYEAHVASDGAAGLALVAQARPDLVLLDLVMPRLGGIALCEELRARPETAGTPVLIVTALGQREERVRGLEAGADDYLTKPFEMEELLARVRALLRRSAAAPPQPVQLDERGLRVRVRGRAVRLTRSQQRLLSYLVSNPGQVCSSGRLLREVWGYEDEGAAPGLVRWHVRQLRARIEPDPRNPTILLTVPGEGYLYEPGPGD